MCKHTHYDALCQHLKVIRAARPRPFESRIARAKMSSKHTTTSNENPAHLRTLARARARRS